MVCLTTSRGKFGSFYGFIRLPFEIIKAYFYNTICVFLNLFRTFPLHFCYINCNFKGPLGFRTFFFQNFFFCFGKLVNGYIFAKNPKFTGPKFKKLKTFTKIFIMFVVAQVWTMSENRSTDKTF